MSELEKAPGVGDWVRVPGLAYGPHVEFRVIGVDDGKLWLKDEAKGWSYIEGAKNVSLSRVAPTMEPEA